MRGRSTDDGDTAAASNSPEPGTQMEVIGSQPSEPTPSTNEGHTGGNDTDPRSAEVARPLDDPRNKAEPVRPQQPKDAVADQTTTPSKPEPDQFGVKGRAGSGANAN